MAKPGTKAISATLNRLREKYAFTLGEGGALIVADPPMTLFVESMATLADHLPALLAIEGDVYVVMTNGEAAHDASRLARGTRIGVIDPYGEIVKAAGE